MNAERRYFELQQRVFALCHRASCGDLMLRDELLSVANLAFAKALSSMHRCHIDRDDWIMLKVQNDVGHAVRAERRRRRNITIVSCDLMTLEDREKPAWWYDLSEDARLVVEAFSAVSEGGLLHAKELLYATIGWRNYWSAVDEIKAALEA